MATSRLPPAAASHGSSGGAPGRAARSRWVQLAAAAIVFTGLSFAVFGWYALHGGFVADDWVNAAHYYFHSGSGFWGAVLNYQTPSRPVAAVYVSLTYAVLGMHLHYHLVLAVLLAAFLSTAFFAFLRTVGLDWRYALAVATVLLVFPSSDATRLWATGSQIDLFIGLYLIAATLAIRGRRRFGPEPSAPAVATQALASTLAVMAVAGYEIVAPAVLLSTILYRLTCGRDGAVWRWLLDSVPTVLVLIVFTRRFGGEGAAFGVQLLTDARLVADGALHVLGYTLFPTRSVAPWAILTAVAAVFVVILLVRRIGTATPDRDSIVRWLRPLLAALAGIVVGYLMIVPVGNRFPLYAPGVQNRVNCFAALGFSALVVFLAAVIAATVTAALPRLSERSRTRIRGVLTGLAVLAMLAIYTVRIAQDSHRWETASNYQAELLAAVHSLVPSPRPDLSIFTSPYPSSAAPGVPIFGGGGDNDELGAFKVSYDEAGLRAFPLIAGTGIACGPTSMKVPNAEESGTEYGRAVLVDLRSLVVYRPRNQRQCSRDTRAMRPYGEVNLSEAW
jgi:hypothetical protein